MGAAIVAESDGLEPLLLEKTKGHLALDYQLRHSELEVVALNYPDSIPSCPVARSGAPMRCSDSMVASLALILRTCVHHCRHSRRSAG
ncbi:hypothetical protein ACQKRQ_24595 [Paraburkholderia sp. NPDC080076]|uniref:hypothetical protein n=1 Tax=Paraburkholderia sp. NPDC080076 TaxID=3390605 RepID=UPI003D05AFF9